ncbi:MAG: uracil-DNA glycosylase family protein [Gammaproteobacteria bacterium]
MNEIQKCQNCSLCNNQEPLIQTYQSKICSTFFVGLSAVQVDCVDSEIPFSKSTRSGALLRDIAELGNKNGIYFTNVVKCLPLKDDKIRYPTKSEMDSCFPNFELELSAYNPQKLVLFGRQVANYVVKRLSASLDQEQPVDGVAFYSASKLAIMTAPHPSYMLIYKRKNIDWYVSTIREFCSKSVNSRKQAGRPVHQDMLTKKLEVKSLCPVRS